VSKLLAEPAMRQRMADLGAEAIGSTPAELAAFLKAEIAKWAEVVKTANIKAD
jgi:tripartite-type tricarboxylate transporter receptor subunit TctC